MTAPMLALDFGTSNSAAAILQDGAVRHLQIERGESTLPTAVFLPTDGGAMQIGRAAENALISGEDGRYMRALKSVLGTALFHEQRLIGGKRQTIADIVTAFLVALKTRAEAELDGTRFTRVLSGRPVHFHSADPERDARAEEDLRACYHAAGFTDVRFMFEPEAAALATASSAGDVLRLIVDIGGGTSDFSVVQSGAHGTKVIASHGIRLGGTDFDQSVSLVHAMPVLGLGGQLRRTLGEGLLPVPRAIYADLSAWPMIPFVYTPETSRSVADLIRHAVDPAPMHRLSAVIEHRLGHDLAFAVERGKIAANGGAGKAQIDMGLIEQGLSVPLSTGAMNAALAPWRGPLRSAMYETLALARTAPAQIGAVILVGGSSLMSIVEDEVRATCPAARLVRSDAFTAVIDGLALATAG